MATHAPLTDALADNALTLLPTVMTTMPAQLMHAIRHQDAHIQRWFAMTTTIVRLTDATLLPAVLLLPSPAAPTSAQEWTVMTQTHALTMHVPVAIVHILPSSATIMMPAPRMPAFPHRDAHLHRLIAMTAAPARLMIAMWSLDAPIPLTAMTMMFALRMNASATTAKIR